MEERVHVIKNDLDNYLSSRRKKYGIPGRKPERSLMSQIFGKRKKKPVIEEQDELTVKVDPATGKSLAPLPEEKGESKEVYQEIKPRKKSFISSILSKIGGSKDEVDEQFIDEYEEEMEGLDKDLSETREDIKAVAKFATEVMAKLPPNQVDAIKETPEFGKFKEVLKRYELIK